MEQDLAKSLVELIDQTIAEIEELKKSDRFSAAEIKLEGPGEGIDGKPVQGKLGKEEEDEKKKKEEEAKKAEEDAKKAETVEKGVLDEAEKVKKEEDKDGDEDADDEDDDDADDKAEKAEKQPATGYEIKKSEEEMNTLMKSMIDERVKPLESKLDSLISLVKDLADAPAAPKAVSYKDITPLKKSDEDVQPLNKSEVASKLLDLKKSGQKVDSIDITHAELGNPATLQKIVAKYNIK